MSLDTLSLARELRAADLAPMQAEASASAIGRAVVETAATKADLLQVRTELKGEIDELRAELKGEIRATAEALKASLLTWFVGTQFALGAVLIAALKL